MIISDLFKHQWQKTFRAPGYYKNLAVTILMAFVALYFVGALMFFGAMFPVFVADVAPQFTAMEAFSGSLLYMLLFSLAMRYFMQSLGTINLQPYQILPIKRSVIVNYILLKPLLTPANYLTLAFVIPFVVRYVSREPDALCRVQFVAVIVFLIWFNVLVASYLKRRFSATLWGTLGVLLCFGAIAGLEYFKIFSLFSISKNVFGFLLSNPFGLVLVLLLPLGAYYLNKAFFRKNYYAESFEKQSKKQNYISHFSFMDKFGKTGELMQVHIKTFLRNKRMKATLWTMPFILLYGLLFYNNSSYGLGMKMFAGIFVTGFPMLILGQWAIGLNSTYFDAIMSKKITVRDYILSFYYMMFVLCIVSFILTTPYFFYGKEIMIVQTVAFLYNIGVNISILLFFSTFNDKRIELNTGGAMNYQGVSMKNFLVMIPIMIVPMLMIGIANAFNAQNVALWILAILGILGIISTKPLLAFCEKQFLRRKYILCEGFRKKDE
ncbi:MAG: DUF5687 family protein [Dysgonamonadaceae bacterium]|jgi:hypothetical protein|nr:DUF5687 family protein [Dysgonamonadaceae bacterium]